MPQKSIPSNIVLERRKYFRHVRMVLLYVIAIIVIILVMTNRESVFIQLLAITLIAIALLLEISYAILAEEVLGNGNIKKEDNLTEYNLFLWLRIFGLGFLSWIIFNLLEKL